MTDPPTASVAQRGRNLKFTGYGWSRIWVNSKAPIGIFSQTAGSTCEFWVNPVNFTFESLEVEPNPAAVEAAAGSTPCGHMVQPEFSWTVVAAVCWTVQSTRSGRRAIDASSIMHERVRAIDAMRGDHAAC